MKKKIIELLVKEGKETLAVKLRCRTEGNYRIVTHGFH